MNAETGNSIWRLLHAYANQFPHEPTEEALQGAQEFLLAFDRVVMDRSYGCACHNEWRKIVAKHPPSLHSRQDFQKWCIAVHDWINKKLGRKIYFPDVSLVHTVFTNPP